MAALACLCWGRKWMERRTVCDWLHSYNSFSDVCASCIMYVGACMFTCTQLWHADTRNRHHSKKTCFTHFVFSQNTHHS